MFRISITPLTSATLISLALIIQAPAALVAWDEAIGFGPAPIDRCSLPVVPCDTDSDCETKNPHLIDC